MQISRDVIIDLLPAYLSGEASADTRRLIEARLEEDTDLAALARASSDIAAPDPVLPPLSPEHRLEAFREAKRLQTRRMMIWAGVAGLGIAAATILALVAALFLFRGG